MIVLDTMVVSALMEDPPSPIIVRWLDGQRSGSLWLTSITTFEISIGLNKLPGGRKRQRLERAFQGVLKEDFGGRVLTLDLKSGDEAARFAVHRRQIGRPVGIQDALIAGIAKASGAAIATRNTRDFEHAGIALLNPWESQ